MANMTTDYSLGQEFKNKYRLLDKLNKELIIISQLIESLSGRKIKADKDKEKEFIERKRVKLDELQRLGQKVGVMTSLGMLMEIGLSGLAIISDVYFIYEQLYSGKKIKRKDFIRLHKKIISLMESKDGVKQLIGENQILGFFNGIGLNEADYRPTFNQWLGAFFEEDSLINKTSIGSVYIINRIYNRFFYLYGTNFDVSLVHVRGEVEKVMNREMSSLLTEDYQWFGLYVFVVYKVLDRFLRPISQFKDSDEFMNAILFQTSESPNETNIMDTLKAFVDQVTLLQEESNAMVRDIPHKISAVKGLKFFQEMSQDSDSFIASLSSFVCESPWIKKQQFFLGVSERNIISLLDMIREKVVLKEKDSLVSRDDVMSPEWCETYLSYYYKAIKESIHSFYVFEEVGGEARDLQIFFEYLSCDKLHKAISLGLSKLFFAIQPIADLQNSLSRFKEHLLVDKIPYTEKCFLTFIDEKEKELAIIEDKNKLFEDGLLFFNQIKDAIPFLSVEKQKAMDDLQEKWKNKCELLGKECINDKQEPSKNPIHEIETLSFSEPLQKSILLAELLSGSKARFRELSANILVSLVCIEERAHDYKKTNKNSKLLDRFKSASGQVYAAVWYLKKFFNIESEITMTALLEKIIERIETDDEENKNSLEIELLKKEIVHCSESIQSMVNKVKELKGKLIELKQKKEVLMLGREDEKFSFATIKKMAKIVGRYEQLKDQFLFLYNLMRIVSVGDQLKHEGLELTSLYELFDDLASFKETYRTLDKHRDLLCNVAASIETVVREAPESATKQDDPIEEKQPISPGESALEIELSHETPAGHEVSKPLDEGFENWKNKIVIELNQVTSAIMNASNELLDRLYPLFVKILRHYQQKIEAKRSEMCLATDLLESYSAEIYRSIDQWLNHIHHRVNARQMTDCLVASIGVSALEKEISDREKRLFDHSQLLVKPLCQNASYDVTEFGTKVHEADEQLSCISQLRLQLELKKEEERAIFKPGTVVTPVTFYQLPPNTVLVLDNRSHPSPVNGMFQH